jgi:D-glycero-D-manno-heptose 1,7-bisphosphate phosphatase
MRAVFLDRDGVINLNRADHVTCWDEFQFVPGALTALHWLRMAGFHVFVVTNQAIVGRGVVAPDVLDDIHRRMALTVLLHGGTIHDIRFCPHTPETGCACRKPQPGMLIDLARRWRVDLGQSYLVGDAWTDIAAGRAADCRCVLVRTGRGAEQINLPEAHQHTPDHIAADLLAAVEWLFQQEGLTLPCHEATPAPRSTVHPLLALQVGG